MKKLAKYMRWQKKYSNSHYFIYLLKNILFSVFSSIISKKNIAYIEKYDIVFLARSKNSSRFENIITNLPENITYVLLKEPSPLSIIMNRMVVASGASKESYIFHIYELYANYILHKYDPKVVITDSNGSVFHPFLTKSCSLNQSKHVHIAHSVPTINYSQFSLISYDYYLIYGKSSYENIKNRPRLYGNTKFIFTGSHHINKKISNLRYLKTSAEVFLLLGSGPGFEKKDNLTQKYYEMAINYVSQRPNALLVFKPHPRSDIKLWYRLTNGLSEKKFIKSELFPAPSCQVKLAFCGYTNAILDVARLGVIPCLMSQSTENDFFNFKDYLFEPVNDAQSLKLRADEIINNQDYYKSKLEKFINYHLEDINSPELYINGIIETILDTGNADRFVNAEI